MRSIPLLRPLAMLLAILTLTGCSTWRPAPGSPDPAQLPPGTDEVRVTLSDGSRLQLHRPLFLSDSLRGVVMQQASDESRPVANTSLTLAAVDIASLESRQPDSAKIAGVILGVSLVAFLVALGSVAAKQWKDGWSDLASDKASPPPPASR